MSTILSTRSMRLCMVAAIFTAAMACSVSVSAQGLNIGGNGGAAGNNGGFGASLGGNNGSSGNVNGPNSSSGNFNIGPAGTPSPPDTNVGSISPSLPSGSPSAPSLTSATSTPPGIKQAFDELSPSEQKKIRRKCSAVLAKPMNYTEALVALCAAAGS